MLRIPLFLSSFLLVGSTLLSQKLVSGEIIDAATQKGIEGVSVEINDGKFNSKTDKKGKFKIFAMSDADTLKFFHDKYYSEFTVIGAATTLKVDLDLYDGQSKGEEIGYGKQERKSMTSSVATVKEGDFNKGVNNDIYQLLRGRIPGLIIQNTSSDPNAKPLIMLRGASNFNQSVEPLIVINGVADMSVNSVDPNDVETVTVLKDASAQAIYGARGTAGVIIITTKKGKKN